MAKLLPLLALFIVFAPSAAMAQQGNEKALIEAIDRATDGYKVADQSRDFSKVKGVSAMEFRVEVFDEKLEIKGGPNLRDWLYSGMIQAQDASETEILAEAAARKKSSPLLKLVCLRALRRGKADVFAKPLLSKAFDKVDPTLKQEWQLTIGTLLAQGRLDISTAKGGEQAIRERLLKAGAPFLAFGPLSDVTIKEADSILQVAQKTKDSGDLAQMIYVLATIPLHDYRHFNSASRIALSQEYAGPKVAIAEAAVQNQVYEAIPILIQGLLQANDAEPSRFANDYSFALRRLSGQQFGSSGQSWQNWWNREGKDWLAEIRSGKLKAPRMLNAQDAASEKTDTVAQLFGIPVDSSRVAIVIDGSGSMNEPLDHRTCAEAAADELEAFLAQVPKDGKLQLHMIVREGHKSFKKAVAPTEKNCKKAVDFVRRFDFGAASAMYDVLIEAQEDLDIDTIVFISDGGGSWGSFAYAGHMLDGLKLAHQRTGVRIHCICVGSSKTKLRFMKDLSELTGGKIKAPSG